MILFDGLLMTYNLESFIFYVTEDAERYANL
jgi:hypothetical protein